MSKPGTPGRKRCPLPGWVVTAFVVLPACSSDPATESRLARDPSVGTAVPVAPAAARPVGADSPSYVWRLTDNGVWSVGNGRLLGAFVRDGDLEPVMRPEEVTDVGWVRVTSIGDDRWAWLLEEVSRTGPDRVKKMERIVYAESIGPEWTHLEEVPQPDGGKVLFSISSPIVASLGDLHWVIPFHDDLGAMAALRYRRTGGVWTSDLVVDDWVESLDLVDDEGEVRMGYTGRDLELGPDHFSLRVTSAGTDDAGRLFTSPRDDRVSHVRFASTKRGVLTSWHVDSPHGESSWASLGVGAAAAPTLVDGSALATVPVAVGGAALTLVHHHNAITGSQELRIYRIEPDRSERIASLLHPYLGYFTAVGTGSNELSVIGPDFDPESAHPFVRSLVLRLSISCT